MTAAVSSFIAFIIVFAAIGVALPTKQLKLLIPIFGVFLVGSIAPYSLIWLLGVTLSGWFVMRPGARERRRSEATGFVILSAVAALVLFREVDWLTSLGAAYFTLRMIHVVVDTWLETYEAPTLGELVIYMLYPPVFLIGPIHRFPTFQRQIERRRVRTDLIAAGAERVLVGLFMTTFLGGYVIRKVTEFATGWGGDPGGFIFEWIISAIGWIDLYFVFGGLSSVAVGCSLIVGLKVEENFNHPYRAQSLIAFWSRWHMSLTSWCRDYIYRPMTTYTRKPVLGVLFSMLVLGLWHETSFFYVGWSIWQAIGIILSRFLQPIYAVLPRALDIALSPFLVLGWLSLANPVMSTIGGML